MRKSLYVVGAGFAAVAASNAAAAGDAAKERLQYTSTVTDAGVLRMNGSELSSQKRFDFRVLRNGYVSGEIDGRRVSFWVPAAQRDRAVAAAMRRLAGEAHPSDTSGTR